jgi:hypothetical protein
METRGNCAFFQIPLTILIGIEMAEALLKELNKWLAAVALRAALYVFLFFRIFLSLSLSLSLV